MAMCAIAVVGAAPGQCFSPGAIQITSARPDLSIGPPSAVPGRSRTSQSGSGPAGGCAIVCARRARTVLLWKAASLFSLTVSAAG